MMEIPKTNCKGCDGRDRIITSMAEALDNASRAMETAASLMSTSAGRPIEVKRSESEYVTPLSAA